MASSVPERSRRDRWRAFLRRLRGDYDVPISPELAVEIELRRGMRGD